ncbi:MAG TPA: extracellular solute-binding protein [Xanthobacteraceae bacterium]
MTVALRILAAGATLMLSNGAALAQSSRVAEIASYAGPDRAQRLAEGGKREGVLTMYSNAPTDDNAALVGAFEKKYGIKVNLYRASSEEIRQRALAEAAAKRFDVDFILNNGPAMEAMAGEKLLQEVPSPYLADLMARAIPPHREWVGFCLNVLVQAYNTDLIKKAELPKSYADLRDPRWKGRIAIEADDSDWFAGLMGELGEEAGVKLFREIAAANGFSVRKGHTLLTNLVAAGEAPLALTVFNYTAAQLKKRGAPIDWFVIEPLISMPNSIAVARMAPHPAAAVLMFDFMLSDAQKILADRDYVATSRKVGSPLDRDRLTVMDSSTALAQAGKWERLYQQILSARP